MAKKKEIKKKEYTTAVEEILNPDFSSYIKDGKLDGVDAFENHINMSSIFLHGAMALLEDEPVACGALTLLKAFQEAMVRGIEEGYRVREITKDKKAA